VGVFQGFADEALVGVGLARGYYLCLTFLVGVFGFFEYVEEVFRLLARVSVDQLRERREKVFELHGPRLC
jgi:hypothetical protein